MDLLLSPTFPNALPAHFAFSEIFSFYGLTLCRWACVGCVLVCEVGKPSFHLKKNKNLPTLMKIQARIWAISGELRRLQCWLRFGMQTRETVFSFEEKSTLPTLEKILTRTWGRSGDFAVLIAPWDANSGNRLFISRK